MSTIVDPDVPDGTTMTSGGTFDRTDAPVYFLATHPEKFAEIGNLRVLPYILIALNDLQNGSQLERLDMLLDLGCRVLLDSGVFNLTNEHARKHNVTMDEALALAPAAIDGFDALYDRYCSIVDRYHERLWGVIEIDQGGADNKRRTRERLMSDLPRFVPIPVYHPLNDGADYFDELAERFDRICAGNVVQASYYDRVKLLNLFYEQRRRYPHLWVHVLGYTPTGTTSSTPIPSCDSSSWIQVIRWNPATVKIRGMLQPLRRAVVGRQLAYRRGATGIDGGYEDSYRWSAYRAAQTGRSWRLIEAEKERLGLCERQIQ